MIPNAILTGSYAYGTPHEGSDIDLVVLTDLDTLNRLRDIPGGHDEELYDNASLRFGNLNLLVMTDRDEFDAWMAGTAELRMRAPVTREQAKALLVERVERVRSRKRARSSEGSPDLLLETALSLPELEF